MVPARLAALTPQAIDRAIATVGEAERAEWVEDLTRRLGHSYQFVELLRASCQQLPSPLSPLGAQILLAAGIAAGIEIGYVLRDQLQGVEALTQRAIQRDADKQELREALGKRVLARAADKLARDTLRQP